MGGRRGVAGSCTARGWLARGQAAGGAAQQGTCESTCGGAHTLRRDHKLRRPTTWYPGDSLGGRSARRALGARTAWGWGRGSGCVCCQRACCKSRFQERSCKQSSRLRSKPCLWQHCSGHAHLHLSCMNVCKREARSVGPDQPVQVLVRLLVHLRWGVACGCKELFSHLQPQLAGCRVRKW